MSGIEMSSNNNEERKNDAKSEEKKELTRMEKLRNGWAGFRKFMWNSETHEFMRRTPLSWLQIIIFYIMFYGVLAAFWAICLKIFLLTLNDYQPTQIHKYSMLKDNPGMTNWPVRHDGSTLYKFTYTNSSTYTMFTDEITAELSQYYNRTDENVIDCTQRNATALEVCAFNPSLFFEPNCSEASLYGFAAGEPCILLRPNKIYAWQPVQYAPATLSDPRGNYTNDYPKPPTDLRDRLLSNPTHIGLACQGENDGDVDNIFSIEYYPNTGIPFNYYPYLNQPNYLPPYAMAKFRIRPGTAVMVFCSLWANNIIHNMVDMQGGIHFELQVDSS